jgi:hypothetical protein
MTPEPSYRITPAVVYAPFCPVGYVLVDAHLLLPAIWHADTGTAPATGDRVMVKVPHGRPSSGMLPLLAYPIPSAAAPAATALPKTVSSARASPDNSK